MVVNREVVVVVVGVDGGVVMGSSFAHSSIASVCGLNHEWGVVVIVLLIFLISVDVEVFMKWCGG